MTIAERIRAAQCSDALSALILGASGLGEVLKAVPMDEQDLQQEIELAKLTGESTEALTERMAREGSYILFTEIPALCS